MESNPNKPAADVRAASVARLRRATSLPRMKDGRRPAVHGSDGDQQDHSTGITPSASTATTPFTTSGDLPPLAADINEPNKEGDAAQNSNDLATAATGQERQDADAQEQAALTDGEPAVAPALTRGRRRRSRSRGSRSGTPKLEIPPSSTTSIITPVQRPGTPAAAIVAAITPELQSKELPQQTLADRSPAQPQPHELTLNTASTPPQNRNRTFITPISPFQQSLFPTGQSAFSPNGTSGPPTLAELQSNYAAGGLSRSVSVGRAHALHKLTGGNLSPADSELFPAFGNPRATDTASPSGIKQSIATLTEARNAANTPPPAGVIARSNTVAGGERGAARAVMLQKLRGRVGPVTPTSNALSLESPVDRAAQGQDAHGDAGHDLAGVESVVNTGTEEVLVMPEIVARENKRRRRRSKRTSSNAAGINPLTNASEDGGSHDHPDHNSQFSADERRFGSEGTSASAGTTPASQFSPLPSSHPLPVSGSPPYHHLSRFTPSPRPSGHNSPALPLDGMVSLLNNPRTGGMNGTPNPEGSRRIDELNDVDLLKQEERLARYHQGLNLLRAASGGSATGANNIKVLIEEEDEPLPISVMEPTSAASHQDVPEAAGRPSIDSMEPLEPPRRPHHSNSPSLMSSTDGQSSPGFGNIPGMGRVPIVLHQYGQDGQPTGFGRKGRVKAGGIEDDGYPDDSAPLVNIEPFPMSITLSPGKTQPFQFSEDAPEQDEQHAAPRSDNQVVQGSRLAPAPRAWEPKSTASASWIVDSYFRDDDDTGDNEDYAALASLQQGSAQTAEEDQDWVPVVPPKDDWDHVLPQPPGFASRASPAPTSQPKPASSFQPEQSPAIPIPARQDVATPASDLERMSAMSGSDFPDKNSSSSGPHGSVPRRLGTSSGIRDTTESQDSYRMGYTASPLPEVDEDGSGERKGTEKVSGWTKVKQTFIGRRSRSNSLVRERTEKGESGISRESGTSSQLLQHGSNGSTTVVANAASNTNGVPGLGLSAPSGMHSTISIPRGVSPLPPPSSADFARYNDSKLMPFPGIYQLEEQRHNRKMSEVNSPGEQQATVQHATYQNMQISLNPAALSAPLPPSTRHSPDEGSEPNGSTLQRNPSTGNLRQQDRAWPLSQDEYFEPGSSVSRSGSTGSNVKKWLKVLQPGSASNSLSPSPTPYNQQTGYSLSPPAGEKNVAPSSANLNRRPSAAEIFLPHGGLPKRPSTPNLLQGLSRKSSLADTGAGGGLKSTPSKNSLRKAFGLFSHDSSAKDNSTVPEEDSTTRNAFARQETGVTMVQTIHDAFSAPAPSSEPASARTPSSPPQEQPRPPSPAPLSLPPPSTVPIPTPAANPPVEPPRATRTPPPISRMRSPPPNASRPQSPLMRAQSPSILKKDSINRAQSPPIRSQSPGFELMNSRSPHMSPPRSHSPFLVHSPSLIRSKPSNNYMQKALSSAEIIASIDSLLNRNSAGSIESKSKPIEDPPRKLLLVTPVFQVVSRDSVKDRTLFLFSDLLIIAKCMTTTEGGLVMDKSFTIKNVIELKRCSTPILSTGSLGLSGDRRSPLLQSFVSDFSRDQMRAINKLCDAVGIRKNQATFVADVLFKTHEIGRPRLGDYLARKGSRDVLNAFIDKFNFAGIRIDHALRIFLLSILLSDEAENSSLENLLTGFAARWFAANGNMVAFDKECTRKLVISIILLNASHHMRHAHSDPPATPQEFFESVRGYDPRYSIKDDLLEDIYEAIKQEKISAPKEMPGDTRLAVTISGATNPMHFIYRVKSDVVRVCIPAADPNFRIHLLGQGLLFEPPTLHFANSSEATFRVTGTSLGTKSILYWRAGANAHLYSTMPLASEVVIERAFMRNTLRIEVKEPRAEHDRESLGSELESNYGGNKKVYVFSIEDPREYDHWAKVLKTRINRANGILDPERPPTAQGIFAPVSALAGGVPPRIRRAAEMVAFEVLKESLIGSSVVSSAASSPPEVHIPKNTFSASFSQVFSQDPSESKASNTKGSNASGNVRDGREIETLCVQNSLIPALISMLATAQRESAADNSHVGSGIGRPQTPKAINVVR